MSATNQLNFQCKCGTLAGVVERATSKEGDYVVCHCTDCQALPKHLGAADRILDDHAGTPLFQSRCARVRIHSGLDVLAGLHMTEGPTLRWYASCCNTPMFNTYANGSIPYITTLLGNCDQAGREALGQPLGHLFLSEAKGDISQLKPLTMGKLTRRFLVRMIKDIFSGDRRRNVLFDPDTLEPIVSPRRLTEEERFAADAV